VRSAGGTAPTVDQHPRGCCGPKHREQTRGRAPKADPTVTSRNTWWRKRAVSSSSPPKITTQVTWLIFGTFVAVTTRRSAAKRGPAPVDSRPWNRPVVGGTLPTNALPRGTGLVWFGAAAGRPRRFQLNVGGRPWPVGRFVIPARGQRITPEVGWECARSNASIRWTGAGRFKGVRM